METVEYEKTEDYQKAKELVCDFINEVLNGEVNKLKNTDLSKLICAAKKSYPRGYIFNKYVGDINDPDMYLIMQAIYIVVWGDIYDLTFDKLGPWGRTKDRQYPFRGDTMNSFNSVYGDNGVIAKRYELDENTMDMVNKYHKLCHSIGNFIVIPNRKNVNCKRANYYTMQDFYDSFVGVVYHLCYPGKETEYSLYYDVLASTLMVNGEYKAIGFKNWCEKFFLDKYTKDGEPYNVFKIDIEMRDKEYKGRNKRSKNGCYSEEDYATLAKKYYETSKQIIEYRADRIVRILEDRIREIS